MARFLIVVLATAVSALATQVSAPSSGQNQTPTFNKDVLPILQRECQACHRPGEVAPMSFLTYDSTRPWAKSIKQAVLSKKMPPWFADSQFGDFRNAPKLAPEDVQTLVAWADGGASEGNPQDKPAAVQWPNGWRTKPDVIISMPESHNVAAKGSGEIKSFLVRNPFKEDTWVSSIEIRPGDPSVVHHVILQVPEEAPAGDTYYWGGGGAVACSPLPAINTQTQALGVTPISIDGSVKPVKPATAPKPPKNFAILEAVYAPGSAPMDFAAYNSAKLIPGGGDLRMEVHYTPNGKATADQTRIGFTLAKKAPQYRFVTLAPKSLANTRKRIPAGAANYETRGELVFGQDARLVWLMPHMHLRGKDMTFKLISPKGGDIDTLLSAKFNFDWQLGYEFENPIRLRKGTQLAVIAHHDNSANNPYNPSPDKEVEWGSLTSQEMVLPWFGVIVDRNADPEKILSLRQGGCTNTGLRDSATVPGLTSTPSLPIPIPIPAAIPKPKGK
jgi:hypothetical protein